MKKRFSIFLCVAILLTAAGCGNVEPQTSSLPEHETTGQEVNESNETAPGINKTDENPNILVAYFSRVGNTDFPDDIDAVSSASLIEKDGERYGNTQYIASLIQQATGGDLFLIATEEQYPVDYDETVQIGKTENDEQSRPALASHVDDMSAYDLIFLGYPNWWYDMPMAIYTFLEEYDFSGKTIIPFVTSGGSGFSQSISEIQALQPGAEVLTDGYKVTHSKVNDVTFEDIESWLDDLGFAG